MYIIIQPHQMNVFPRFDSLKQTTRTVIVKTNMSIDICRLYPEIPVSHSGDVQGSVVFKKFKDMWEGAAPTRNSRTFKNSITILLVIGEKRVNIKLSANGTLQITGNNEESHYFKSVKYIHRILRDVSTRIPDIYSFVGTSVHATFYKPMSNYMTRIGRSVNREKLSMYVNNNTEYVSIYETSSGSASVNIKIPLVDVVYSVPRITYRKGKWILSWVKNEKKDSYKVKNKKRYVTFLVFHTGVCIMTSEVTTNIFEYYNSFINLLYNSESIY